MWDQSVTFTLQPVHIGSVSDSHPLACYLYTWDQLVTLTFQPVHMGTVNDPHPLTYMHMRSVSDALTCTYEISQWPSPSNLSVTFTYGISKDLHLPAYTYGISQWPSSSCLFPLHMGSISGPHPPTCTYEIC